MGGWKLRICGWSTVWNPFTAQISAEMAFVLEVLLAKRPRDLGDLPHGVSARKWLSEPIWVCLLGEAFSKWVGFPLVFLQNHKMGWPQKPHVKLTSISPIAGAYLVFGLKPKVCFQPGRRSAVLAIKVRNWLVELGVDPHFCDTRESLLYMRGVIFVRPFLFTAQKWSFPTALLLIYRSRRRALREVAEVEDLASSQCAQGI